MILPNLAGGRLTIDLGALIANWRELDRRSRPGKAAAVVKANAYGLGVQEVVPALAKAGCEQFFVAQVFEGIDVKKLVPDAEVFVLNGIHKDNVSNVAEAGLVPVLASSEQIDIWARFWHERGARRPCALHVDTGMNRSGLSVDQALAFAEKNRRDMAVTIIHVMSHFACADDPDHPLNAQQIEQFQRVKAAFGEIESSLSNSAGILGGGAFDHPLTRPGIALYGGEALSGHENPMQPVALLEGRIQQVRTVRAGQTVSYGATQSVERDTRVATVSVGYADGYPRSGSGAGVALRASVPSGAQGFIGGQEVPLLGRVTMDMTLFDVTEVSDKALDDGWIELFGPNIRLDDVARAAGTIGYELLTGLGDRYERRYIGRGD